MDEHFSNIGTTGYPHGNNNKLECVYNSINKINSRYIKDTDDKI